MHWPDSQTLNRPVTKRARNRATNPRRRGTAGTAGGSFRISVIMHWPFPTTILLMSFSSIAPARHAELRAARSRVFPCFPFRRDDRLAGQPFQRRFFFSRTGRGPPERRFHHAILQRLKTDHRHPPSGGEVPGDRVEERSER